jgi:hypothetical protein
MIAADYAKALYELGGSAPRLRSLRELLKRRGHERLLPKIYSEYQKISVQDERLKIHKKVTPEKEQTRILLELYRKLTHV